MKTIHNLFCVAIVGVYTFAAWSGRAQPEVDWDSLTGFTPDAITINAGDEVDFVNQDPFGVDVDFIGNPPESFSAHVLSGTGLPYVHVYNNPGVFTVSDDVTFTTVTITVNAVTPLFANITDPSSNAVFIAPATFPITAVPSGGVTPYFDVQFFVGTNGAGDFLAPPFTTTVTNLPVGSYVLYAIVSDNSFNLATDSIPVTVVPPPRLDTALAANKLIVSWPTNYYSAYSLESATNLTASWNTVTQAVTAIGTQWVVTNPVSGPRMFFRLSSP